MSTSTVACYSFAAPRPRRSARKANSQSFLAGAAVTALALGCAWTVYASIFAASPFPQLGSASFDEPVNRRWAGVVVHSTPSVDGKRVAQLEPPPLISAPAAVPSGPSLSFDDRFAAAAPQGVAPAPQPDTSKLAAAPKAQPESAKLAEASRPKDASSPRAPVQVAAIPPAPSPAEPKSAKTATASVRDMAQRAKAAVMSIASNEKQTISEKLWGRPQPHGPSLLSFASADASVTGSLGPTQNPALAGSTPRYDQSTAVYDISAHTVYLPDGSKLEAHSGLGSKLDDPGSANIRMRGVTPPHIYELKPREALFHGVPALRLNPIGGEESIYGRSGLLAHTYMLGPNGDSNGCVSFRDYNAFLNAYRNQGIKRLAVVARVE
ncbi:MAG: tlde1 domain-containing protein [Bradyrhizobium sp.]